jgi:hypothetical protein
MKKLLLILPILVFVVSSLRGQSPSNEVDTTRSTGMTYKVDGGDRQVAVPKRTPGRTGNVNAVPVTFINVSQHSAYVNRPPIGPGGYQLYFVEGMAIGGNQAIEMIDDVPRQGIYIIADLLKQGEAAHSEDIGKSFAREKIFCLAIFPNGNEFRYPENGGPYKAAN